MHDADTQQSLISKPSLAEAVSVYARLGCISFGGPAGQIALMHREFVDERGWIDDATFLHALNFCHLLPGPEAQQLATWIGWRMHGTVGGLLAGLLFILPGAIVMLALSTLYVVAAGMSWFAALFLGVKAAVLAIIIQALVRIGGRSLKGPAHVALALAAGIAIAFLRLPFPLVVLGAGAIGWLVGRWRPDWLSIAPPRPVSIELSVGHALRRSLVALATGAALWAAPMLLIAATLGRQHVLWDIGSFFSKLAMVTFGGAYAVLAYMAQEAVSSFGWLNPGEMADGLGLAESTPGPLILVTQFVGFLAAWRDAAPFSPWVAALLGTGLTLWVTFVPCFIWIFTFAPWIDRLQQVAGLRAALSAITAAIVGVIGSLALWFALHLQFQEMVRTEFGHELPIWSSLDWRALLLALLAGALLRQRVGVVSVLLICGASAFALVVGLGIG